MTSLRTKCVTIEGVEIHSTELEFCDATDLLADLTPAIAPAGGLYETGQASRGDALAMIAREVVGGRLVGFLTRVLAGTTIVAKGQPKVDLIDSREKLNQAFSGRKKLVFPAVKLALEVNFKDFLDGLELIGAKVAKVPKASRSEGSSPNTGGTA